MKREVPKAKKTIYTQLIKRILDIVLSGFGIIILSPLFIIVSILEVVFHGLPILYTQERPGLNGEIFKLYKFRSMTNKRDKDGILLPERERLTKFGKIIRRLSIDELPELFCILSGKMSIIGPRPLLVDYLPLYTERHKHRHDVRPGLACISLKPIKTWSWNDQFENDIWYVEHCSFVVDFLMIFAIVRETMKGAEYRVTGVREEFTDTYYLEGSDK